MRLVLFYTVWALRTSNRGWNLCMWGFYLLDSGVWVHISGTPLNIKLLESWLLLGIQVWDYRLSGAHGVDLRCAPWEYPQPISVIHCHCLSLWHFHLTCNTRALRFTLECPELHDETQHWWIGYDLFCFPLLPFNFSSKVSGTKSPKQIP